MSNVLVSVYSRNASRKISSHKRRVRLKLAKQLCVYGIIPAMKCYSTPCPFELLNHTLPPAELSMVL